MPKSSSVSESGEVSTEEGTSANALDLGGVEGMEDWVSSMSWVPSVACVVSTEGACKGHLVRGDN